MGEVALKFAAKVLKLEEETRKGDVSENVPTYQYRSRVEK
jgi:hypothetical protein